MNHQPRLLDAADLPATLALIRQAFAFMEGRIDPPSSMHRLSEAAIWAQAQSGEVWLIGAPKACVFLTPERDALYIGKLAVAEVHRGTGLARAMIEHAASRAKALGKPALTLQTRVELTENHAVFRALGFVETARQAHAGYDRPTSISFRRAL